MKRRQFVLHGPPHPGAIDHRLAMNQDVTKSHDVAEIRDPGRKRCIQASESIERFPEDLELPLHCGPQEEIAIEIREALARGHIGDGSARVARVPEEAFGVTPQRWTRASARRSP